jgi:hypothetical protein
MVLKLKNGKHQTTLKINKPRSMQGTPKKIIKTTFFGGLAINDSLNVR